jgi:hypothetical protein
VYNLSYTPTTLGVRSWREITSGGIWDPKKMLNTNGQKKTWEPPRLTIIWVPLVYNICSFCMTWVDNVHTTSVQVLCLFASLRAGVYTCESRTPEGQTLFLLKRNVETAFYKHLSHCHGFQLNVLTSGYSTKFCKGFYFFLFLRVASITNNVWGCRQSQQYFSECLHYYFACVV